MVECYFCGAKVADDLDAAMADWCPSFYDGEKLIDEPCCAKCAAERLQCGADGEMELQKLWGMTA